jgi:hypothetical protein
MPRWTGRWTARVDQSFEIDADSEEEFEKLLDEEMAPSNVVELFDFGKHSVKVADDDEG